VREAKANPNYDVIDRLDISGLYGGGGEHADEEKRGLRKLC